MSLRLLRCLALLGILAYPNAGAAQSLAPCPEPFGDPWQCGSLTVPENRQTGEGQTIVVEIKIRRATGPTSRPPIFLFSGGPGAPTASAANSNMMSAQAATHDLVLIDQRGTGASNGFRCELGLREHPERAFGQLYPLAELRQCWDTLRERSDPDQYTTADFAADVDAVREWLGYQQVIVQGGSYGTRAAMTYMSLYPEDIAGAVLNAVLPPDEDVPLSYARSSQDALDLVFADCRAQTACGTAYPDLETKFERMMDRLRTSPSTVRITGRDGTPATVQMHANDLGYAVRILLYNRARIPELPRMLYHAATTGDLRELAQAHYDRAVAILSFASLGLHFSVFCAEDVPWVSEESVPEAVAGTYFGRYFIEQYRQGCLGWAVERRDRRSHQAFTTEVPVLLLSGRYDPVTPPAFAERVRQRFHNSRHIVKGDGGHGASGACVSEIVADFYHHLDPTQLEDRCATIRWARFDVPETSR